MYTFTEDELRADFFALFGLSRASGIDPAALDEAFSKNVRSLENLYQRGEFSQEEFNELFRVCAVASNTLRDPQGCADYFAALMRFEQESALDETKRDSRNPDGPSSARAGGDVETDTVAPDVNDSWLIAIPPHTPDLAGFGKQQRMRSFFLGRLSSIQGEKLSRYALITGMLLAGGAAGALLLRNLEQDVRPSATADSHDPSLAAGRSDGTSPSMGSSDGRAFLAFSAEERRDGANPSIRVSDGDASFDISYIARNAASQTVFVRTSPPRPTDGKANTEISCIETSVRMDDGSLVSGGRFRRSATPSVVSYAKAVQPKSCPLGAEATTTKVDIAHVPTASINSMTNSMLINWIAGYNAPFYLASDGIWFNPDRLKVSVTPVGQDKLCLGLDAWRNGDYTGLQGGGVSGIILNPKKADVNSRITMPQGAESCTMTAETTEMTVRIRRDDGIGR